MKTSNYPSAFKRKIVAAFLVFLSMQITMKAQNVNNHLLSEWQKMHNSKKETLQEFNENKFGMFIHWGAYSLPAGIWKWEKIKGLGEWIMYHAQIPRDEYREMCSTFNPTKFNAEEWVKAAKMAGMKYIVAMPKHHDGFAMYDSKVSEFDIVDLTPFGRDPMDELYQACKKHGIRFAIYYSHAFDWTDGGDAGYAQKKKENPEHNDSYGANLWDPSPASFEEYIENKAKPQMRELLTKFPEMMEIWYDFPRFMNVQQSFDFYKLAYEIQPNCLINSRVGNNLGDFFIPGDNEIPASEDVEGYFWETPGTLNNTWGFKSYDTDWKSTPELIFWITEIACKGGNYLLNVGPTAEGLFPEESIKQLREIGDWMSVNGESVYGTKKWILNREGPTNLSVKGTDERAQQGFNAGFTSEDFWFTTNDNILYVTSLKLPESKKVLVKSLSKTNAPGLSKIKSVQMLGSDNKIDWKLGKEGLQVTLPADFPNPNGYVLKVIFE
jgi:alpha-L-fucosidase